MADMATRATTLLDQYLDATGLSAREVAEKVFPFPDVPEWEEVLDRVRSVRHVAAGDVDPSDPLSRRPTGAALHAVAAWVEKQGQSDVLPTFLMALAAQAYQEAEQAIKQERRRVRQRPRLQQGSAALRAILTTETHISEARRKGGTKGTLTHAQTEAYKLFVYEPLGWSERLVIHGLTAVARDQGLLEDHPWATAGRPVFGHPAPRARVEFPGFSELARILGFKEDRNGKIPRSTREALERALTSLCTKARWIATPVQVPPKKRGDEWREEIEVQQDIWMRATVTLIEPGAYIDIHPAAFASYLRSFLLLDELAGKWEAARDAIGARQMRDEWAILDDYLRWLGFSTAAAEAGRKRRVLAGQADAAGEDEDGEDNEPKVVEVGDLTVTAAVKLRTLMRTLSLEAWAKKNGKGPTKYRIEEALRFCQHVGTIRDWSEKADVFTLVLPNPDSQWTSTEQLSLLPAER